MILFGIHYLHTRKYLGTDLTMTSHSPLIKLSFNQNFLIILNFLTRRWLCLHSFPQWLPKWWIYKWKLTVQMRLYGFIFIPSRLFLVRFTPFTRTVLLFLGVFWADFYLESRIQAVSFTGAPSARNAGWKKKQNRNAKQTPKQSSREIVIKKKTLLCSSFCVSMKILNKYILDLSRNPLKTSLGLYETENFKTSWKVALENAVIKTFLSHSHLKIYFSQVSPFTYKI